MDEATRERSRRAADADAVLSAVMNGLTDPFMIPYALALGGTAFHAGLLSSMRNLLLAGVQLGSAEGVRRLGSRRRLVLVTARLQALLWIPMAVAGWLVGAGWLPGSGALLVVVAAYTVGTAVAALGGPAWGSLVADYTAPEERGRYFGARARRVGLAVTVAGMAAGFILDGFESRAVLGFGLLCFFAFVARSFSVSALARFHDEGWREEPHLRFSFWAFLRQARRSNFARFSLCQAATSFSAHVAAPFFAVYLLQDAGYSYLQYTVVVLAGSLTGTLSSPWWGRHGDRYGNRAILRWTTLGVSILPLLWMVSPSVVWMLGANVAGAFLWGGLNLSATNFVYDAVTPAKRHTCIAYFNVLNGLGVSLGAFTGGWIATTSMPSGNGLLFVFAASTAFRLVSALSFDRFVREVRPVRQVGMREVVLDLVGQRLVGVLGFLSVRPERERPRRRRRRVDSMKQRKRHETPPSTATQSKLRAARDVARGLLLVTTSDAR